MIHLLKKKNEIKYTKKTRKKFKPLLPDLSKIEPSNVKLGQPIKKEKEEEKKSEGQGIKKIVPKMI